MLTGAEGLPAEPDSVLVEASGASDCASFQDRSLSWIDYGSIANGVQTFDGGKMCYVDLFAFITYSGGERLDLEAKAFVATSANGTTQGTAVLAKRMDSTDAMDSAWQNLTWHCLFQTTDALYRASFDHSNPTTAAGTFEAVQICEGMVLDGSILSADSIELTPAANDEACGSAAWETQLPVNAPISGLHDMQFDDGTNGTVCTHNLSVQLRAGDGVYEEAMALVGTAELTSFDVTMLMVQEDAEDDDSLTCIVMFHDEPGDATEGVVYHMDGTIGKDEARDICELAAREGPESGRLSLVGSYSYQGDNSACLRKTVYEFSDRL